MLKAEDLEKMQVEKKAEAQKYADRINKFTDEILKLRNEVGYNADSDRRIRTCRRIITTDRRMMAFVDGQLDILNIMLQN